MTAYIKDAYKALDLGVEQNPLNQNKNPEKEGTLSGHKVAAVVVLTIGSIMAAVAAVATAIFGAYLAASICIAASLVLGIAAIVASRVQPGQNFVDLIKNLTKKVNEQFQQIIDFQNKPIEKNPEPNVDEMNRLKQQLEDLRKQNLQKPEINPQDREIIVSLEKEIELLKANLKLKSEEAQNFQHDLLELQKKLANKEIELSELQQKYKTLEVDFNKEKETIQKLRDELAVAYKICENLQKNLEEKERELKKLKAEIQELKNSMPQNNDSLGIQEGMPPEEIRLNEEIAKLNKRLTTVEAPLQEKIKELEETITKKQADLNIALGKANQLDEVTDENKNLSIRISNLQQELSQEKRSVKKLTEELTKLEKDEIAPTPVKEKRPKLDRSKYLSIGTSNVLKQKLEEFQETDSKLLKLVTEQNQIIQKCNKFFNDQLPELSTKLKEYKEQLEETTSMIKNNQEELRSLIIQKNKSDLQMIADNEIVLQVINEINPYIPSKDKETLAKYKTKLEEKNTALGQNPEDFFDKESNKLLRYIKGNEAVSEGFNLALAQYESDFDEVRLLIQKCEKKHAALKLDT